jgi:hypothetical protein
MIGTVFLREFSQLLLRHGASLEDLIGMVYTKGTTLLKLTGKQEKEDAEVLPIEKLKGIYPHKNLIDPIKLINFMNLIMLSSNEKLSLRDRKAIFNNYIFPFTIGVLALNTRMRNSEISRIKREDFIGVKEKETFLLRIWNNKTDYFNKTSESKYRKIPLHIYTIETVNNPHQRWGLEKVSKRDPVVVRYLR